MAAATMDQDAFKCVMAASWCFRRCNSQDVGCVRMGMMLAGVLDRWEDRNAAPWYVGKDGRIRRRD